MDFFKSGMLANAVLLSFGSAPSVDAQDKAGTVVEDKVQPDWAITDVTRDRYIDDLMHRMTLPEKIGQLTVLTSDWDSTGPSIRDNYVEDIRAGKIGAIFNAYTAAYTKQLQEMAVEDTRLGIPLLFGYDVIHGHRTIFPISLGEAASWDMDAIRNAARISATEAAAEGIHWTFSPMVDIGRDARWGRVSEGAGEDVYLGSQVARARVEGYQGDNLSDVDTVLATAKHFAAYGAAQAGRDYHTVDISDRTLHDVYLPPFRAAADAGVASFMTAFNDVDGVPATGSEYLLTEILRDDWGFDGFVVTDYTSINEMVPHGYATDLQQAAEQAIDAGVDMDMQGAAFMNHLETGVDEGRIEVAMIDRAVRRVLEAKYRLGLFEDPYRYSDVSREAATVYRTDFLEAARDMARRSIVLLKNEGDVLPLASTAQRIAVIGPLADSETDMIGSWSAAGEREDRPVTVLEALEERLGDNVNVGYTVGASYNFDSRGNVEGFDEAVRLARDSDIVIAVMGERWDMTGEAASRTSLDLPGNQQALLERLVASGTPVVLVVMSGRPNSIQWANENVAAILHAWYPGTMGGHAVVDVIFGDYNPSGKLPMTFPRNVGQVPIHYDMKNTGRPIELGEAGAKYVSRYLDTPNTPLYRFGYGLSYTSFDFSPVSLSNSALREGDTILASAIVENTGEYAGETVAQLYVQDLVGSTTRPVQELKGFEKFMLQPGESKKITFAISPDDLAFTRSDGSMGWEPGEFRLWIAPSSGFDASAASIFSLSAD